MKNNRFIFVAMLVAIASLVIAACTPEVVEREVTRVVEGPGGETTIVTEIVTVIPEGPAPVVRDTLVICMGQEPDTLYPYGGSMLAARSVQEATFDALIEGRTYDFVANAITAVPTLDTGLTVINVVDASEGDTIVDDAGNPTVLEAGVVYRPSGCNSPDCAVTYDGGTVQLDQMAVTFELVEGLTYADGTPVTSADSLYSFDLAADPDTPVSKYVVDRTASYEAPDDRTMVWTGLPGYIDATYFANLWTPYPQHVWGDFTAAELLQAPESSRTPLGYGPYQIVTWETGQFVEAVRNPFYFRADEGLPYFERVIYRFVGANSNANIAALLSGDCDIVDQTAGLEDQSELLLELQAAGQLDPKFVTGTTWEHADFIMDPVDTYSGFSATGAFQDVRLRRAIAHCMDRQAVVDSVLFGQSIVLDTYLPPEHPLFNDSVRSYEFDVAAGTALLEEAGWVLPEGATVRVAQGVSFTGLDGSTITIPDGTPLQFRYGTTNATLRIQITQVLQQSMVECGIGVDLEYFTAGEWFANGPDGPLFGRRYDFGQFAWLTGVTPACNLYLGGDEIPSEANNWGGQNNTGWYNAEYDAVCNAALQSLYGTPEYAANHLEAQRIFGEELPVIPLILRLKLGVARPEISGYIIDPTINSDMWNIENFGINE